MEDYLVVGLGLAGIAFCETLERNGKSFRVIDEDSRSASRIAGGLYNPVVLKRLNRAWKADVQLPLVAPFYRALEQKLQRRFHFETPVFRRFSSIQEQNQWFAAADDPLLQPYLASGVVPNRNQALDAPFGFGRVLGTGRVDTAALLSAYRGSLLSRGLLLQEQFDHGKLLIEPKSVAYGSVKASKIVFATGSGMAMNPYFTYLPLQGNKGEYLEILAPALGEERVVKASVFLIPLGGGRYSVGATYNWKDQSPGPTPDARAYLEKKLADLLNCPYEVIGQVAGIRPTVPDRRPLVGRHPQYGNLFVLNGFGSRGVMTAPFAAQQLFEAAEGKGALDPEFNIDRFKSRYPVCGNPHRPQGRNG